MDHDEFWTVQKRLAQASMLSLSALELVRTWKIDDVGAEFVRRQVAVAVLGLAAINRQLVATLRRKGIAIGAKRCPLCGWSIPPRTVPLCPRCNGPREMIDDRVDRRGDRKATGT